MAGQAKPHGPLVGEPRIIGFRLALQNIPMAQLGHKALLDRVREVLLSREPEIIAGYIYGSYARAESGPQSDLDLAVLLPPGTHLVDKLALMAALSRQVHREVDVVNLREAGLDLIREVLRDGHKLFDRDKDHTLAWEAERMTDYSEFNPRRAELLDMYLREPLGTAS